MTSSTVECHSCDGEGVQYDINYYTESPIPVPCDSCRGAGIIETAGDDNNGQEDLLVVLSRPSQPKETTMATLDDDNTNYYRDGDKPVFIAAGDSLIWGYPGFAISDTTQAEKHAELMRVQREAADAKQAASILHKKLQQEQARNATYSEVLNAFLPLAEALGFGPQLTAEVAQKALAIVQEQKKPEAFDFTRPFKGALPKSSPIADAARSYKLKPGERWLVKNNASHDTDWTVPLKGITPWFDNLAWEYKLSVGKCGDCGRKACTPTCNAAPDRAQEWVPLTKDDIKPGSALDFASGIYLIVKWNNDNVYLADGLGIYSYEHLSTLGIDLLEPSGNGIVTRRPCKKLKESN